MIRQKLLLLVLLLPLVRGYAQEYSLKGYLQAEGTLKSAETEIFLQENGKYTPLLEDGSFQFDSLPPSTYTLTIFNRGYQTLIEQVEINNSNVERTFFMNRLKQELPLVSIEEKKDNTFGISRLKPVEGTAIYAGKKSEVINLEDVAANLATNNARQVYSKVSGLNIWESDDAGIQLGIGGRGLSPNRVSNFNTRQNGYDISADALGYPESYYSPPTEGIERIEVVRGAASLQYGTQFGGFLNFKLKDGPEKKRLEVVSRQTLGSYGLFNSFNSIGGNEKKWKYYTYYQYKTGDGWRPNSQFDVHNWHANVSYRLSNRITLALEYTFMHYLAQQAGGLTDVMFERDPTQSIRARNWFKVDWNLLALKLKYQINDRTDFDFRGFGLLAGRDAVGILDQITRADEPDSPRNLLSDNYQNIGFENRLLHRYSLWNNTSVYLIGMRYYNGFTERKQGNGSTAGDADFSFKNESLPDDSQYDFPSQNIALFTENVFYITSQLTVTPGLRLEHISTNAEGYYFDRFIAVNGDTLKNQQIEENRSSDRSFLLAGLGLSFKPNEQIEVYTNFSQNYRSINFNDMRIDNPNYLVDPDLKDEKGFSADIGIRGNKNEWFNYDLSFFLLSYNDRIGTTLETDPLLFRPYRYRTNISDSRNIGVESFMEVNLFKLIGIDKKKGSFSLFTNFSLMDARYINSDEEAFDGNKVELVPDMIFKGGFSYTYNAFRLSCQYSYTAEHFSDATNADYTSNAVEGLIPAYSVMDLSIKYAYKKVRLESGVNNLMDEVYFTRRASGYPGPGIIPATPRTYYITVGLVF